MKNLLAILSLSFGIIFSGMAQPNDPLDGSYPKKPVPYRFVREADMMWTKTIWRIIDLREKINFPLYYPTVKIQNRMSLIELLLYGIKEEGIQAYNPDDQDEFVTPMLWSEIESRFGVKDDTVYVEDPETEEIIKKVIHTEMETSEVKKLMLKELWFFDKQRSQFEVRIVGICPIREYVKSDNYESNDPDEQDIVMKKLFWVYFPSVRFLLASHWVFNPFNDSQPLSFDDIFFKRRFSSFIYKESNVYNNRSIVEYKTGLDALLESEKIKDEMFIFEHDLWEH